MIRYVQRARRSPHRGFALIEGLIAVVVLAAGLLALTALQGALIRSSADAKARSILAAHAQAVMDAVRTRGIGGLAASGDTSVSTYVNLPLARVADAMGVAATGASRLQEHSVVTVLSGSPDFKRIDLRFDWVDAAGGARSLRMSSAISPLTLSQSPLDDLDPPSSGSYRPIVRRPTPVTEGMIPLALGTGATDDQTAATNPKPELIGRDNDTLVSDTRFDLLTFNTSDNLGQNGFVRFDKRIETAMVGCTCQTGLSGFPTGGNAPEINSLLKAKAFLPSYWDGTRYTEPLEASTPARSPDDSVSQSQLCDVCCRDHADPATGPKYNPWVTGEHPHYNASGALVVSGSFQEACRVIRVNGVWRVTPDPRTEDIALLPTQVYPTTTGSTAAPADNNSATSPLVSTAGKTSYITFAYDFVKQFFYDKTVLSDTDRAAMQTAAGVNNPEYVPIKPSDTRWLHARTIMADKLEQPAIDRIQKAIDACTATNTIGKAQCVLPYVPMATINATELATWSGKQTSETGILLTGSLAASIVNYGQALLNRFVSALALVAPISPTDDDNPIKDEQPFALVPPTSKSGTWLSVASPSSVIFGDPANPKRGFATLGSPIHFDVTLGGVTYANDSDQGNDPALRVLSVTQPCKHGTAEYGTDHDSYREPFACPTDITSNIVLAFGTGLNYLKDTGLTGPSVPSTCGTGTPSPGKQAKCIYYQLAGGTIDGTPFTPTTLNYRLESGTLTKPTEISSVTIPSVSPTTPSAVTLNFTEGNFNAVQTCGVPVWSCN